MIDRRTDSLIPSMEQQTPRKVDWLFISLILVCVLLFAFLYVRTELKNTRGLSGTVSVTPEVTTKGSMQVKVSNNKTIFKNYEKVMLVLSADSANQRVSGYDAIIFYNPDVVFYSSFTSNLSDFDVVVKDESGKVRITGFKKLLANTPTVFSNSEIGLLTFTAKKLGSSTFAIEYVTHSQKDSNIMTDTKQPKDILATTSGTTISVTDTITVSKSPPVTIPQTSLQLFIRDISIPSGQCADCITTVTLVAQQGEDIKVLTFSSGGIAGIVENKQEAFGYVFLLTNLSSASAQFSYYKK